MILKTLISWIRCVWLGLELNCAEPVALQELSLRPVFRATYAPLQMTSISGKALCISAAQCKTYTAAITTAWLRSRRARCWIGLPAVEIFHLQRTFGTSLTKKICQRWPRTLQHLEIYIRHEWDQIPTPKLQKLITSMPRHLQTVLKEEECYTMVNIPPSQLFWDL